MIYDIYYDPKIGETILLDSLLKYAARRTATEENVGYWYSETPEIYSYTYINGGKNDLLQKTVF